jgi:ribosomal protein S18 acetylase RimI-like enzyme
MYRWFMETYPDLTVLAEIDGRPVGFAVGSVGGHGRRLARAAWLQIAVGLCRTPSLLIQAKMFRLWKSYAKAFVPGATVVPSGTKVSLASIGVARMAQGTGVGARLMGRFEEAAVRRATTLGLSVESTNRAARRLYESCGWILRSEDPEGDSAYYVRNISRGGP